MRVDGVEGASSSASLRSGREDLSGRDDSPKNFSGPADAGLEGPEVEPEAMDAARALLLRLSLERAR